MARVGIWPDTIAHQRLDMIFILEARNGIVGCGSRRTFDTRPERIALEERQTSTIQEIMNERRDEHRLAGTRQACDAKTQCRIGQRACRSARLSRAIKALSVMDVRDGGNDFSRSYGFFQNI